jgi:hypothetical protein
MCSTMTLVRPMVMNWTPNEATSRSRNGDNQGTPVVDIGARER